MATVKGGDKFAAALGEITRKARSMTLRVGFLENSTYPSGVSVPMVAAIQEFGAPSRNIPPRPFFRGMIQKHSKEWPQTASHLLKINNYDVDRTLKLMGEGIRGQLQQSIRDFVGAPLSPRTIARKGHAKQLIDTSHMLNSIDYEVS